MSEIDDLYMCMECEKKLKAASIEIPWLYTHSTAEGPCRFCGSMTWSRYSWAVTQPAGTVLNGSAERKAGDALVTVSVGQVQEVFRALLYIKRARVVYQEDQLAMAHETIRYCQQQADYALAVLKDNFPSWLWLSDETD